MEIYVAVFVVFVAIAHGVGYWAGKAAAYREQREKLERQLKEWIDN